jgi:hypothetical protein
VLGAWAAAAIVVGTMIGTGIFLKPSSVVSCRCSARSALPNSERKYRKPVANTRICVEDSVLHGDFYLAGRIQSLAGHHPPRRLLPA